ncbi:MAG: FAD-dependent oxidoreductase [Acidobacteria bacterium]|nr:FAD-dependent oxidoreductase [Acidobacteriota bacterium]
MSAVALSREPERAAATDYELIIAGGGIYGATLALEAARRGVRCLLLERADFGGATSWNSLRIVHGGLRYLQSADLPRFAESVRERRWLLDTFPDLVRPLACLMPLYSRGLYRPAVFRAALLANDLLTRRVEGAAAGAPLPRGRVLGREETLRMFPQAAPRGLAGAALWHDAAMPSSQRLLVEMLRWAVRCGASVLNHTDVREMLVEDGRVAGIRAEDRPSGVTREYRAPVVVNCAGPWSAELAARFDRPAPGLFRPSLAFNVLLDRVPPAPAALAVSAPRRGARIYFLHPWQGRILAGTCHAPWPGPLDDPTPPPELVATFLAELNEAAPGLRLERGDILRVHAGLLPAREAGTARLSVRPVIRDHGACRGPHGLFSVSGVKFTTARAVAERTLRAIYGRAFAEMRYLAVPRPEPAEFEGRHLLALDRDALRRLLRDEAALHLDDLLLRRVLAPPSPAECVGLASRICEILGYDRARTDAELARLGGPAALTVLGSE